MLTINGHERRMVLAMRKCLLSHPSYARIYQWLIDFCRTDDSPAMQAQAIRAQAIRALADLIPERSPA
jgi:hypothetical protein